MKSLDIFFKGEKSMEDITVIGFFDQIPIAADEAGELYVVKIPAEFVQVGILVEREDLIALDRINEILAQEIQENFLDPDKDGD